MKAIEYARRFRGITDTTDPIKRKKVFEELIQTFMMEFYAKLPAGWERKSRETYTIMLQYVHKGNELIKAFTREYGSCPLQHDWVKQVMAQYEGELGNMARYYFNGGAALCPTRH